MGERSSVAICQRHAAREAKLSLQESHQLLLTEGILDLGDNKAIADGTKAKMG
ncbi:hypothetical protein [Microseira sp. BLCC-F43]|uniref:hypothetical protein n=1 Tax=Microseira sp. BLCC-F43 TaxID=3153602 RepID=UPI0035B80BCD